MLKTNVLKTISLPVLSLEDLPFRLLDLRFDHYFLDIVLRLVGQDLVFANFF